MKGRQWACIRPGCQRKRQQENQRDWVTKNPDYYRGRYENTRLWLESHPGYLKNWRFKRRDIQDSVIDDSPYFTGRYVELKSVIYKSPWTEAAYFVFCPP